MIEARFYNYTRSLGLRSTRQQIQTRVAFTPTRGRKRQKVSPSANIAKVDAVSQRDAIVVARRERPAHRDGYWNGFSNVALGTRESLPLQRSKYILLCYALMHYSALLRETVVALLSYFVARSCTGRLVASESRHLTDSPQCSLNVMTRRLSQVFTGFIEIFLDEASRRCAR